MAVNPSVPCQQIKVVGYQVHGMGLPTLKYRRGLLLDEEFLAGSLDEHPYDARSGAWHIREEMGYDRMNFGPYFEEHAVDDLREIDAAVRAVAAGREHDQDAVGEAFDRVYDALAAREDDGVL